MSSDKICIFSYKLDERNNMNSDPEWQNYLKLSQELGYLIRQENQLMQNVDFYPHSMP